jgi:hypothetical protein
VTVNAAACRIGKPILLSRRGEPDGLRVSRAWQSAMLGMELARSPSMRLTFVIALMLLAPAAGAQVPVNDCSDASNQGILRCALQPAERPYLDLGEPAAPQDVKSFTRVFLLADPSVRCFDGTAPTLYVDPAVDAAGNTVVSDKWLFTFTGGGSCAPRDSDGDGVVDDLTSCLASYRGETNEMSSAASKPMKELVGIHRPDPQRNPVFAGYNRVRIDKCSFDRYNGRAVFRGLTDRRIGTAFDAYQQGYSIITAAFTELLPGLTYTTWKARAGRVVASSETLPPLAQASAILFLGHSGSAQGLMHNIDHLAADLAALGVAADVRAALDAHFLIAQETEAAFTGAGDLYDHIWTGTSPAADAFTYDDTFWAPGGAYHTQLSTLRAELDQSCLDAHAASGDGHLCHDYIHVLLNHVSTPFFVREDYRDSNHSNPVEDHELSWGPIAEYPAHCPGRTCVPVFAVPGEHRGRLNEQADRLWFDYRARSEIAEGIDTSMPAGQVPSFALWMPNCGSHAGAYDDAQFFGVSISSPVGSRTMESLLASFMASSRIGRQAMFRDDWVHDGGFVSDSTGPGCI